MVTGMGRVRVGKHTCLAELLPLTDGTLLQVVRGTRLVGGERRRQLLPIRGVGTDGDTHTRAARTPPVPSVTWGALASPRV